MPRDKSKALPATAQWLGRAGLVPFLLGPVLIAIDPLQRSLYVEALSVYALCILCFLAGSWWGLSLIRRYAAMLIASNVLVVAGFLGWVGLGAQRSLPLLACLLVALLLVERRHPLFLLQPRYYRRLRCNLTTVAAVSLLLSWTLTSG
tara:strand:+ start:22815 stop:23258 length:444 start_codon:yes stop_codon:yes gene_type:complete